MERSYLGLLELATAHQCASKFDMGLNRAWVTACPPPPKKKRVRHVRVTRHFHFFPDKDKPWKTHSRAHKTSPSMKLRRQPSKKNQNDVSPRTHGFVSRSSFATCSRSHRGWIQMAASVKREWGWVCFKSSHQRSQSRCVWCVLVRKAQTNTEASRDFKQVKADCDGSTNWPRNTGRREGMLCQVHLARL